MRFRQAARAAVAGGACVAAAVCVSVPLASGRSVPAKVAAASAEPGTPIYLDRRYSYAERAADLVSRMTTAEKASQTISSAAPAIPRLGIRQYGQWNEALHGVSRSQLTYNGNATVLNNTTSYPTDQTMGSSWDPDLLYRVARSIGDEAREVSPENILNLEFYSPTMNLQRDPRWGRTDESYGEDPLHTARMVSQFVNGMEGKDEQGKLLPEADGFYKTLTTIKHYAANNSEINRRSGSSDMDDRTLREYYTAAFREVVRESQPGSVMSSYNSINAVSPAPVGGTSSKGDPNNPAGAPTSADPYLIDTLLRQTFGFEGYVTSDCDAVFEEVRSHRWTIPAWPSPAFARPVNNTERNALAQSAGEDSNCNAGFRDTFDYLNRLPSAAREGIKTLVDTYNENDLDAAVTRLFTARMKLGEFDDPSLVPWVSKARDAVAPGSWSNTDANAAITQTPARLALAREAADKTIVLLKNSAKLLPLKVPTTGTPRIAVMGVLACPAATVSGAATTCPGSGGVYLGGYSSTQLAAGQKNIVTGYDGIKRAVQAINPNATVDLWRGFTGTGATASTLTSVDPAAVAAAGGYDAVVLYVGTDASTADEDRDRTSITLPGAQSDLVNQVAAKNPNTVVYAETIGPVDISSFEGNVSSLLWSSYNGQRKGEALADVLLGAYNPSGRTPSIWPRDISQLPEDTDYDIHPTGTKPGRTYMYYDAAKAGALRYPFGYGQSYSTFAYSNLRVDDKTPSPDGSLKVDVDVKNTSDVAGTDVVQLYVTTPDAPAARQRPAKRLEGFSKVALAPGETKTVSLTVRVPDLAFYDEADKRWELDQGRYGVQIARSSADVALEDTITVSGDLTPRVNVVEVKPAMAGDAARDIVNRVVFPAGAEVRPNVTVSMTDDTLYGAGDRVHPGKAFPDGMTIAYSSNRPSVVRADGAAVHAVGAGVATVTATATYHGVSRSRDFVVRVVGSLDDIRVNGRSLGGLSPEDHSYEVIVPDSVARVPEVGASVTDGSAEVEQASDVPGTATVTVDAADGVSQSYAVHFAHPARGDEFDDGAPGPQWSWIRRTANSQKASAPGALRIVAEPGDLLSTPIATTNNARNLLVQRALGDWTIESKIDFSSPPSVANQQAGIMAYQGDDDYLRFGLEYGGTPAASQLSVTTEDSRSCCDPGYAQGSGPVSQTLTTLRPADITATTKTVWLRMRKQGPRYSMWYSTDGSTFAPVYETGAPLEDVDVGLFAFNRGGATLLPVSFDYFRISGQSPATAIPYAPESPEATPTPTPGGGTTTLGATATPTPGPAAADHTQPRLRLRSPAKQRLTTLRGRGLAFVLSADENVKLSVRLLGRLRDRRGGRGALRLLARTTLTGVRAGQVVTLRLRPSASLRRLLRSEKRLPAQLRITATDAAGNVTTRSKALSFR